MAFEPHPSTTALARTVTNQHAEIYIYRLSPHTAGCPTSICDHISIVLIEHSRSYLFHLRKWRLRYRLTEDKSHVNSQQFL